MYSNLAYISLAVFQAPFIPSDPWRIRGEFLAREIPNLVRYPYGTIQGAPAVKDSNTKFGPKNPVARYFPFSSGRYEMTPGLFKLGHQFGNELMDSRILQIDEQFFSYREQKLQAREREYNQNVCKEMLTDTQERAVNKILASCMAKEYPGYVELDSNRLGTRLTNRLSGDEIFFDHDFRFIGADAGKEYPTLTYQSGIDALVCQLQEDFCIVSTDSGTSRLQFAHVCFPNNWLAKDKIGQDFMSLHQPVSGFEQTNPNGHKIIAGLLTGGPYIRFAWGLSNDNKLSHPPQYSLPVRFAGDDDPLYLRVERQTLRSIPEVGSVLFFIRTYYYDCRDIRRDADLSGPLQKALASMDAGILEYKGLTIARDAIIDWLRS